ncbi:Uncharacterized protein FKW44_009708 [Caligus rogercresseyi]|uniref:Uncharacterized protein n=1 Tax=Caligus rogercresseyi TaxID=217165 RepID=A0A7T8HFV9_CALRO|nr:Uncharacterized protein FKW44_009708 [Caligus rogercresseyi]
MVLRYTVLPWLKANYPEGNYVWTKDGAPSHTSDLCQKLSLPTWLIFGRRTCGPPPGRPEPV